jgi:hypothetical protein
VVSSQVIQVPHGVGPPAQLTVVPLMLTKSRINSRVVGWTSSEVVQPPAFLS